MQRNDPLLAYQLRKARIVPPPEIIVETDPDDPSRIVIGPNLMERLRMAVNLFRRAKAVNQAKARSRRKRKP
jgi:hypothetical protein